MGSNRSSGRGWDLTPVSSSSPSASRENDLLGLPTSQARCGHQRNWECGQVLLVIQVGEFYLCGHHFDSETPTYTHTHTRARACVYFPPWRNGYLSICFQRSNCFLPQAVPFPHPAWSLISASSLWTLCFSVDLTWRVPAGHSWRGSWAAFLLPSACSL